MKHHPFVYLFILSFLFILNVGCRKEMGCTDPQSATYNPDAEVDDGSCQYFGCTDPNADNFDPRASLDDGNNCLYSGCTDPLALNFDPNANVDNGTCIQPTVFQRLARGDNPFDIVALGIPVDSLYNKFYGGGYIYYMDPDSQLGLILAPEDIEGRFPWGCEGTEIMSGNGADGRDIGTGKANTEAILMDCGEPGIAARVCDEAQINGQDDWFLPSKFEIEKAFEIIQGDAKPAGSYWTSTEARRDVFTNLNWAELAATHTSCFNCGLSESRKNFELRVRPIRSFR